MLHTRSGFDRLVSRLAGTSLVDQWDSHVAKVGGKVFALLSDGDAAIVFKVEAMSFDGLVELAGIGQAPYFARGGWVRAAPGALDDALLEAYLERSFWLVAAGLTRKARLELGIPLAPQGSRTA